MSRTHAATLLLAIVTLSMTFGMTVSGGAAQRHASQPLPDEPGEDHRMSGMGRLARLVATGRMKKRIARARAARLDVSADDGGDNDGPAGGQAETSIAVDSTGQHIVVGVNDTRGFSSNPLSVSGFVYSNDGGATFVDGGQLPVTVTTSTISGTVYPQVFGDPDVRYAGGSTFLYFSIIVKKFSATGTAQSLGVHRSTDFGHTWQGPYEIGPASNPHGLSSGGSAFDAADKEFVDVDPETGRVMLTWTNFTSTAFAAGGAEISSTFSDNATTATPPTWSARKVIANSVSDGQASIPRFAGNGSTNVYVAWRRFPSGALQNVGFARSTDNGTTFSAPINLAANFFTMDQVLGNDRVNTSPSMAVDNSSAPSRGTIYVVYANNDNHDGADIVVQTSIDQGLSFSSPVRINSRPGADRAQWIPWVTVDSTSGRAYVFYYDQGIASDGDLTETTYQFSDNGGTTWNKPMPLTDRPFHAGYGNDTGQPNLGDYNQAVAQNNELFAVWAGNPPLVGFSDGQPSSAGMTVPDMFFKRVAASSTLLSVRLGSVVFADSGVAPLGGNGFIDPGEQITLTIPLTNYVASSSPISGVSATLSTATPGVLVVQGASSYPSLAEGATAANTTGYLVMIGSAFQPGTRIDFALTVSSAQGATTLPFTLATGSPLATTLLSENFDGVAPGALPAGWSTTHAGGLNTVPWTTNNRSLGSAPTTISNAAFHANANDNGTGDPTRWERLVSPPFVVPASADYVTVDFDTAYDTEDEPALNVQAYDGFLLRIGDLTPGHVARAVAIEAFAEEFKTGTGNFYPKHMPRSSSASYLQDLSAWAGDSTGFRHVHLKLPGIAGSTAQLQFEYTQDNVGICSDIRPGHRCGVLVDNVVVLGVRSITPTQLLLAPSTNPALVGQSVTFTATVTTSSGFYASDGAVTFQEAATVLAGPVALSGGRASFTTSSLGLGSHTITATYSSSSGAFSPTSGSVVEQIVTPPTISIADASVQEGNAGTVGAVFHVTLSNASPTTVTVSYSTADQTATAPAEYLASTGTVTFVPGDVDETVTVLVNGDLKREPNETFLVNLSVPSNATIGRGQAVGTIIDDDPPVDQATVTQAVTSGGSRLQTLQRADGGWFFNVGDTDCLNGSGASCSNTVGITALGLLASYTRSGDGSFLTSAIAAGNDLMALYTAALAATPQRVPYSQDIEFLVELGQITGNATYATTAQSWFQIVVSQFPNAADRVDSIIARRQAQHLRTLGAWDSASFIRAAKAVGNVTCAAAAAARVRDREADWKDTNPAHRFDQCPNLLGCGPADNPMSFDYTILGEGSLLWAIHDLPGFDAQISEYRSFLIAQQDPAGSWDAGDSQIASYVVLGLAAVGGTGADVAMQSATGFFLASQLPEGGWPSWVDPSGNGPESTEVDGEIVRALSTQFNTPAGTNVSVAPAQLSTVMFSKVESSGLTSVVALAQSPAPTVPGGFGILGGLTYEVLTTAGVSGNVVACFSVPWITDALTFANVRVLHGENGAPIDRTIVSPDAPGPDFVTRRVCARVASLSPFAPFAIALRDTTPPALSVTLTPSVLRGDNRWVTITATIGVNDDTDPSPTVRLLSITSNDPDKRRGGRDDIRAALGTEARTFQLRAERPKHGTSLVYTVVYRASDRFGNTRDAAASVSVERGEAKPRR